MPYIILSKRVNLSVSQQALKSENCFTLSARLRLPQLEELLKKVAAPIIYSFLLNESTVLVESAAACDDPELMNKYAELWKKTEELQLNEFYVFDDRSLYENKILMLSSLDLNNALNDCIKFNQPETIRAFAAILSTLRLSDNEQTFNNWIIGPSNETTALEDLIQSINKGHLAAVDAYSELLKPFMHLPKAQCIQHGIDVAKAKVSLSKEAPTNAGPGAENVVAGKKRKAQSALSLDATSDQ